MESVNHYIYWGVENNGKGKVKNEIYFHHLLFGENHPIGSKYFDVIHFLLQIYIWSLNLSTFVSKSVG